MPRVRIASTGLYRRLQDLLGRGRDEGSLGALRENNALCRNLDQDRPLEDYEFVVFDTELTGLSPRRDAIVSIGAVRIKNLQILPYDRFEALVKPPIPLPKLSTLIHRITPGAIRQAPPLEAVLPEFIGYFKGALLVGHHVGLDVSFLSRACRTLYGIGPENPCLDTMRLAMIWRERLFENHYDRYNLSVSYNLADLAVEYDLPRFPPHNALADAMQTAYLFLFLVKKLRRSGLRTLKELYLSGRSWRWYT